MKVLMTGASGFIGSYIKNNEKRLTFREVVRNNQVKSRESSFVIGEFNSKTNWQGAFEGIDAVLHLGAVNNNQTEDKSVFNEINHLGTLNFANQAQAAGVKKFIFISTSHVNGSHTNGTAFNEDMAACPHGDYAQSKLDAENSLIKLAKETGLELVIIRPSLVYGRNATNNSIKIVKLVEKLPFLPFGSASKLRSFISVANLSDFIYTCLTNSKASGETFLIADSMLSIKDFTNEAAKGLNKKLIQIPIPIFLFQMLGMITGRSQMIDQVFGEFQVDTSKAQNLLGWKSVETMEQTMKNLKGSY